MIKSYQNWQLRKTAFMGKIIIQVCFSKLYKSQFKISMVLILVDKNKKPHYGA